ncbi:MAG: hypothetical protein OEY10_00035 [Nitrosopumilus sp.]|nr:hypothetical protein [Nitrosopumilus sp.]
MKTEEEISKKLHELLGDLDMIVDTQKMMAYDIFMLMVVVIIGGLLMYVLYRHIKNLRSAINDIYTSRYATGGVIEDQTRRYLGDEPTTDYTPHGSYTDGYCAGLREVLNEIQSSRVAGGVYNQKILCALERKLIEILAE